MMIVIDESVAFGMMRVDQSILSEWHGTINAIESLRIPALGSILEIPLRLLFLRFFATLT